MIRVSPCQQSLSFTCWNLANSKNRSSKIVVEHSLYIVTGQSLVQRDRLLSSVLTSFPGFSPTSPYGVREREFVSNLPDSGRHVTRPNQGLSTGRRENLGTKLHQFINKKILSLGKTSSTRENKFGLR